MLRFESRTELQNAVGEWNARYFPPRGISETTDAFVRCSRCPAATYWTTVCSGTVNEVSQGSQSPADCQSICSSDPSCDLWRVSVNSAYQRFLTPKTYSEAEADCASRGMRLATPRSAADQARFDNVLFGDGSSARAWIGVNDIAAEGVWREGSDPSSPLVSYFNWRTSPHEPNNQNGNEHCGEAIPNDGGEWNDKDCTLTNAYVCETTYPCTTYACDGHRNYTASCSPDSSQDSCGAVKSTVSTSYRTTMASIESAYQRFLTPKTYSEAEADCASRGMRLATPRSAADQARFDNVLFGDGSSARAWIGVNDIAAEGVWREGSDPSSPLVSYFNWRTSPHEPNNQNGNEHCGEAIPNDGGEWNDKDCTLTNAYVCETLEGSCDLLPTTGIDINAWDVSRITDMSSLFAHMNEFNADVNDWDTSSVTTMASIFKNAYSFNRPLNSWDVSLVTDMSMAFEDATHFNQPLSHWKPPSNANMTDMFSVQHADGGKMSTCNKRRTHLAFTASSSWSQRQEGDSLAAVTSAPFGIGWSGFLCKAGSDYDPGGSSLGQSPIPNIPTVLRCQHRCEATPGCVAIVHNYLGQCWLKASYGEFSSAASSITSCVRQDFTCLEDTLDASPCLGLSAHVDAGLSASQCPVTGVSSIEACQQHCRNVTGCEAITYSDAQECWLKSFWGVTSSEIGKHSCRRHPALDPASCVTTHSFCCASGTCVPGVCVDPPEEPQPLRSPNPNDVGHVWDFEEGLGGFVQLPNPGQVGDSGSCGIQPVSYSHARIFKGPRNVLPKGRFVSTYAPGGWQAPSDLYQCTFEDKSHAFTLTPRTMVGLMVSLSKNRYVGLYRCSNDSEAIVTATWPGENNQMVHRTLLNVPFSNDKYALLMGERVFVRFADLSSESWSHIQIDDIEVKGAGDVGPCEPTPPSCWFSGPTFFRVSTTAEPNFNGGRVYLSAGGDTVDLQTSGVGDGQKWTVTSLGGGLMRIANGTLAANSNSTPLSIDPTTSDVGLTEGTGNNHTWAIAYAGEDDIDGETLWTVKSQSLTAAGGNVWLSTNVNGSKVGLSSVVIANSRWRIGCHGSDI